METEPTPLILFSGLATPSSKILYKAAVLSSAVAEMIVIGIMSVEIFIIIGFEQPSGR